MKRIQRKRTKGWKAPAGAVYVGRGSVYGNPFPWKDCPKDLRQGSNERWAKAASVLFFEEWLDGKRDAPNGEKPDALLAALPRLNDAEYVMCWCGEDEPCHGDVLIERAAR